MLTLSKERAEEVFLVTSREDLTKAHYVSKGSTKRYASPAIRYKVRLLNFSCDFGKLCFRANILKRSAMASSKNVASITHELSRALLHLTLLFLAILAAARDCWNRPTGKRQVRIKMPSPSSSEEED